MLGGCFLAQCEYNAGRRSPDSPQQSWRQSRRQRGIRKNGALRRRSTRIRAGDSPPSSNRSVIVGGHHTVARTGPNNTYFVHRAEAQERTLRAKPADKGDRRSRGKRTVNVDEDVQVVVNRSENEGYWPHSGVRAIGSRASEKCACNECNRERRISDGAIR